MPANTPKGYPYPLGTDRLTDGDDAIHNLATAIGTRLGTAASGVVTIPVTANGTNYNVAVTFPVGRFVNPPRMVCVPLGTDPANISACTHQTPPTTAGGTVVGKRLSGAGNPFDVHWIALDGA